MNRVIALIILLTGLALACTPTVDKNSLPIIGQWQWVESVGGFAGETRTPESTGDHMRIEFTGNYSLYQNDSLVFSKPYVIKMMSSLYFQDSVTIIYIENGMGQAFEFSDNFDTLILYDECDDCFTHTYLRIK